MKRLIRDISSVLILSGLLLVADAAVTLVWQEPVTAVVALIRHSQITPPCLRFGRSLSGWHSSPAGRSDRWQPGMRLAGS
jgi:hypothetical protein